MALKGEIPSIDAWKMLQASPSAVLVDVRTKAEWNFVGVPDLRELGRQPVFLEWQAYPTMQVNDNFAASLESSGVPKDQPILFICRSGARSRSAAMAASEAGYQDCFNVVDGFEGDLDPQTRRRTVSGWKNSDLPWIQG